MTLKRLIANLPYIKGVNVMSLILFDTEYTSWTGCNEHGWHDWQKKEIVQISALKIDENLAVLAEFNRLCKPKFNPVLSDYFVDLTGITNDMVTSSGEDFTKVYNDFKNFVGSDVCFSHAWGQSADSLSDGAVVQENLRLYNLLTDDKITYRNIAPIFKQLYDKHHIKIKQQSSGQIVKLLGLNVQHQIQGLDTHNAMFDVYSILVGLRYFQSLEDNISELLYNGPRNI